MLYYISGGQRSGKSSYAQKIALELSSSPLYLATARIWDEDFKKRVQRHRSDRGEEWQSIEIEKNISSLPINVDTGETVVVLDCITLWITNFFSDNDGDINKTLENVRDEWERFIALPITIIAISNEVGMGLHAQNQLGLKFVDLQGFVNQYIASMADIQIFMVSGQPLYIPKAHGHTDLNKTGYILDQGDEKWV